jgi:O-acetylhomoserine (thiol)-lyase
LTLLYREHILPAEADRRMKRETLAIHAGYEGDPTTKAVAVPIYQTVAFEFDSAEHGAALFNNQVEGNIYSRIGNPTNAVLEKRVAALEGGVEALSVSSGMSAIHYAIDNIVEHGNNIVSLPSCTAPPTHCFNTFFPSTGSPAVLPRATVPKMSRK